MLDDTPDLALFHRLASEIEAAGGTVGVRSLMRKQNRLFVSAAQAQAALELLVDAGLATWKMPHRSVKLRVPYTATAASPPPGAEPDPPATPPPLSPAEDLAPRAPSLSRDELSQAIWGAEPELRDALRKVVIQELKRRYAPPNEKGGVVTQPPRPSK